jgi:hypothetical protein
MAVSTSVPKAFSANIMQRQSRAGPGARQYFKKQDFIYNKIYFEDPCGAKAMTLNYTTGYSRNIFSLTYAPVN